MTDAEEADDRRSPTENSQEDGGESNTTCMICMEEWTLGGDHRICCLKCGHLFGRSCIERWIKEKGSQSKCPTCNKTAKKVDLRDLWCKGIKANDNTELQRLQQLLDNERKLRKTDSAVIFHAKLREDMLMNDVTRLKKIIVERDTKIAKYEQMMNKFNQFRALRMNQNGGETDSTVDPEASCPEPEDLVIDDQAVPQEMKGSFHFAHQIESSSCGGCRCFAHCAISSLLMIAQPAPPETRSVFGGFGLRKFSTVDTNIREFIPLHAKLITSVQLKPIGDLILTSSVDKRVRLTSLSNNTCIQTYECPFEPTAAAWSAHRDQQFYVASSNCYVALYDMRNTSEYIFQTPRRIANSRLLSIAATTSPDNLNGLLVNDCRGCQFLELSESSHYDLENIDRTIDHLHGNQMPFEGLMGTVDYHKPTDMALITTRKAPFSAFSMHNLCRLKRVQVDDGTTQVTCESIKNFVGSRYDESSLLSQSRILRHPTINNSVLVCTCENDTQGVKLWDSSDNTIYQSIKTGIFIRDSIMYSPENSNQHVLYLLNDKGFGIYRWDYA